MQDSKGSKVSGGRGEIRAYMDRSTDFRPHGAVCRGVGCVVFRVVSCEVSQTSEGFHPPADFVDIMSD